MLDTETLSSLGFRQDDVLTAKRVQLQSGSSAQPSQSDLLRQALANGTSRALQNPNTQTQPSQPIMPNPTPIVSLPNVRSPQRRDPTRNTPLANNNLPNTDVLRQILSNIGGQPQQQQQPRRYNLIVKNIFISSISYLLNYSF